MANIRLPLFHELLELGLAQKLVTEQSVADAAEVNKRTVQRWNQDGTAPEIDTQLIVIDTIYTAAIKRARSASSITPAAYERAKVKSAESDYKPVVNQRLFAECMKNDITFSNTLSKFVGTGKKISIEDAASAVRVHPRTIYRYLQGYGPGDDGIRRGLLSMLNRKAA